MKNCRAFFLIILLAFAVGACARESLSWNTDGTVVAGSASLNTGLQNAYTAFETKAGLYLGGFRIDQDGANHPQVVFVSADLDTQKSWLMESSVNQFFEFRNSIYVLTASGLALKAHGADWDPADFAFKPDSIVVWSTEDIVACNPAHLLMAAQGRGGCYSLFKGWQLDANWRGVEPKVCNGRLVVLERIQGALRARQIDLATGTVLATQSVGESLTDLCSVRF